MYIITERFTDAKISTSFYTVIHDDGYNIIIVIADTVRI